MIASSDSSLWLEVLAQLHPLVLHFPVAIISVLAIVELCGLIVRRPFPRAPLLVLLWVNVVFAGVSALSGLQLAWRHGGDWEQDLLSTHQVLGVATAIACTLMAVLASVTRARAFYRLGLLLSFGLLVPAGHFGYTLTHGDKVREAFWSAIDGKPPAPPPAPVNGNAPPVGDKVSYVQHVAPVLAQYCVACHGEKKHKGELRLDTQAGILAGSENGEVLVPGKPGDSLLVTNIRLPLEDKEHMPPKTKAQPKREQVELLARWIEEGAHFDGEAPKVVVPDEPDEPAEGKGSGKGEAGKGEAGKEDGDPAGSPDAGAVQTLRDELVHVAPLAEGSQLLRVDFAATAPKIDDAAAVRLLQPLCAHIGELSLARAPVGDATMVVVGRMRSLQRLDLRDTKVSAAGLQHLRGLKHLHDLVLVGTPLLDLAVAVLLELPALQRVYVWEAGFGARSLARLRAREGLQVDAGEAGAVTLEVEPEVKLQKTAAPDNAKAVNAICPVSGKAVDPAVTIVHEGRTIAFCCTNCLAKFRAEPARFAIDPK